MRDPRPAEGLDGAGGRKTGPIRHVTVPKIPGLNNPGGGPTNRTRYVHLP
jgi:hypothetical protein